MAGTQGGRRERSIKPAPTPPGSRCQLAPVDCHYGSKSANHHAGPFAPRLHRKIISPLSTLHVRFRASPPRSTVTASNAVPPYTRSRGLVSGEHRHQVRSSRGQGPRSSSLYAPGFSTQMDGWVPYSPLQKPAREGHGRDE